jgi:pyruvate,water dikinase
VLIAIGNKLVGMRLLDQADDVLFLRYNELRVFIGDPGAIEAPAIVARRRQERTEAYRFHPPDWIGTVTPSQLAIPYWGNWGFPDKFHRKPSTVAGQITGVAGSPGIVEGVARVILTAAQFDEVRQGDIVVCQMTNPAWVVLFTKMIGLVTDAGGLTSHPAVLSREFGIPAVVGTSTATRTIKTGDRIRVNGSTGVVDVLRAGVQATARVASDAPSASVPSSRL